MLKLLCLVALLPAMVFGHGRLWYPPSRSSMWRQGFNNPVNYNDNELYCGGFSYLWNVMNGKCGVCGDKFDGPWPNEAGGKYANGIIGRVYNPGEIMDVVVDITTNHWGWFEFRLCPNNDPTKRVTQACLDRYLLEFADGSGTRHVLTSKEKGKYEFKLKLPPGLTCTQCVLQWKYNTGNSWNTDPDTGIGCVGCGPQEQFYGCSDIAVGDGVAPETPGTEPTNVPTNDPTPSPWPSRVPGVGCKAIGAWEGNEAMDTWCTDNCLSIPPNCPSDMCRCEQS